VNKIKSNNFYSLLNIKYTTSGDVGNLGAKNNIPESAKSRDFAE